MLTVVCCPKRRPRLVASREQRSLREIRVQHGVCCLRHWRDELCYSPASVRALT